MSNSVYQINKGINKPIEFKGLKAQYIWYLGGGLVISIQNKEAKQFKIVNKWLFARQVDGEAKEPEYKVKETSGIYNTDSKLLEESETLDHYSFDIKEKVLFDGTNKYQKIK